MKCESGSWCETLLVFVLIIFVFFGLLYCGETKAECNGSAFFAGYGNGWGSVTGETEFQGNPVKQYRSIHLAVVGVEHNFNWLRMQIYHQSNLTNGLVRSFDDVTAVNLLYRYDF